MIDELALRREDGPGRVPAPEHRDGERPGRRLAGRRRLDQRARRGREGCRTGSRRSRARTSADGNVVTGRGVALGGFASSQVGVVADDHGQQEDRQDHGRPPLRGPGHRPDDQPRPGREPDVRQPDPGREPRGLLEEVAFNKSHVTSLDWVSYPILRFADSPPVTTVVDPADRPAVDRLGRAGNAPVAAAIANAFFDATGVRIRQAPMTPARVRATLKAAAQPA